MTRPPIMMRALHAVAVGVLVMGAALAGGAVAVRATGPYERPDASNPLYRANNNIHRFLYAGSARPYMDYGMYNGQPNHGFYDRRGTMLAQAATYTNDVRANEKGLPVLGLSDAQGKLRNLFRLDGQNQSPLIIFKTERGEDPMIMGLNLNDADETPFLLYKDGAKTKFLFGKGPW